MKLNRLFTAGLAALLFVGCNEKPEDFGDPALTVTPAEVNFETSAVAEQVITVNATREWKVENPTATDWISVSPEKGEASSKDQKVTISVLENKGNDRSAELTFTIGLMKKTITVSQKGDKGEATTGTGTADDPYTAAGALAFIETLGADVNSDEVYVKGIVTSFKGGDTKKQEDLGKYGSFTYYIADNASAPESESLYIYGCKNLNNQRFTAMDQLVVGDAVVIKGKLVNFKGNTPEMTNGGYLISRNGEGEGGGDTPDIPEITKMLTTADVLALAEGTTIEEGAGIEGIIVSNKDLNNLTSKKGAYLQDDKGAIQLRFDADHSFSFGEKVKINLSGAKKGAYQGAVQVEVKLANAASVSKNNSVTPKTVTVADFLANKYEGQYVAIENCQVAAADLDKTFVVGGAHTNINIETADGSSFIVFSSKYSTFGAEAVPAGSGTLKGIASINGTSVQLIFAQASDYAGLTGSRFGGPVFTVSPKTITAAASATSAEISVTSAVAWTAVSETAGFTVSPASGNGNGTITVSFSANESEASRTATIKVSTTSADVTVKEHTVTITQNGKVSEVEGTPITWTKGTNAYDNTNTGNSKQSIIVNGGDERTDVLKLGKSEQGGKATLHIPAGTKEVRFYAFAWVKTTDKITVTQGSNTLGTVDVVANDGITGNPPYKVTVTAEDCHSFVIPGGALAADTDVQIATTGRTVLWGIVAIM